MAPVEGDVADEASLAKESLHCYAMLNGIAEATLGFGISLGFNGETLVNARSPFEFLSYDAFNGVGLEGNDEAPELASRGWECALCNSRNFDAFGHCLVCRAAQPRHDLQLLPASVNRRLGVRQNSCGTERFSHFLPLYLSKEHFRKELCSRCLLAAFYRVPLERIPEAPEPCQVNEGVWHVLPALMNSTAVAMVGGELHTSDVALRGYYNLHRLLLALATPELRARAEVEARSFIEEPEKRLKKACPNLGQFLPRLLLLADPLGAWCGIQEGLLQEALDRTVLHAYREFPTLAEQEDEQYTRLRWQSAAKGFRMLLFSVRFLRHAAQWGSSEEIAAHYDQRYGQASNAEQDAFRQDVREILAVDSWEQFSRRWCVEAGQLDTLKESSFARELGGAGLSALVRRLRESEQNSISKGYHSPVMAAAVRGCWRALVGLLALWIGLRRG